MSIDQKVRRVLVDEQQPIPHRVTRETKTDAADSEIQLYSPIPVSYKHTGKGGHEAEELAYITGALITTRPDKDPSKINTKMKYIMEDKEGNAIEPQPTDTVNNVLACTESQETTGFKPTFKIVHKIAENRVLQAFLKGLNNEAELYRQPTKYYAPR